MEVLARTVGCCRPRGGGKMPITPEVWSRLDEISALEGTSPPGGTQVDVTVLANGNILYSWLFNGDSGGGSPVGSDIAGQIFDPFGQPLTSVRRLNQNANDGNESDWEIVALPDGGFVVVFTQSAIPNSFGSFKYDIELAQFDAAGSLVHEEPVELDGRGDDFWYTGPTITTMDDGRLLIAYKRDDDQTSRDPDTEIVHRIYDPQTQSDGGLTVAARGSALDSRGADADIWVDDSVTLSNGKIALVGHADTPSDGQKVWGKVLNANGSTSGNATFTIDGGGDYGKARVASLSQSDAFVVVWSEETGNARDIRARIYSENGTPVPFTIASAFTVNSTTFHDQLSPDVTELSDGTFVVVWADAGTGSIVGQRFASDGSTLGTEFEVTDPEAFAFDGFQPRVSAMEDGRFVVAWNQSTAIIGAPGDQNTQEIFSAIFDPRDAENSPNAFTSDIVTGTVHNDIIDVAPEDRTVFGHSGADRLVFDNQEADSGDVYDGGDGNDRLTFDGSGVNDFRGAEIRSIEILEFDFSLFAPELRVVRFNSSQVGNGLLSRDLVIEGGGNAYGTPTETVIELFVDTGAPVDVSGWQFDRGWNGPNQTDIFRIYGSAFDDEIIGSAVGELITGGTGVDRAFGGGGNDTFFIAPGDLDREDQEELWGQEGIDTLLFSGGTSSESHDLSLHRIRSIEELRFGGPWTGGGLDRTLTMLAAQIGGDEIARSSLISGFDEAGSTERIEIAMGASTVLDLSRWTFEDWGGQGEMIVVTGDGHDETVVAPYADASINLGGGLDVVQFAEDLANYTTQIGAAGTPTVVTHLASGAETSVTGAKILRFNDGEMPVNTAPTVSVPPLTLGVDGRIALTDVMTAFDADGDTIESFELVDLAGDRNWFVEFVGPVQPNTPFVTGNPNRVFIDGDSSPGQTTISLRVFDGLAWSDSETIQIETVDDPALNGGPSIAETGTLTLRDSTQQTVTLQRSYENPVAIAFVATENGRDPVNVRISEVSWNDLTLQLQEPNYLDGQHAEETVNFLVMEAGTWLLPDGTLVEAGTLDSNRLSTSGFENVAFDAEFDSTPVVLSHVQTFNGRDFVTTRQRAADADGFKLTMQEEDALNGSGHAEEKLGWIALEPGGGLAGDVTWLAGSTSGVTDATSTVSLGTVLSNVLAGLSSYDGGDPAWARGAGGTLTSFDVSVEEDRSADTETSHVEETVDYFAFNESGLISSAPVRDIAETGTVSLTTSERSVTLQRSYDNPVAVAFVATENGGAPVNVRISEVSGNELTLQLQEPNYLDDIHAGETVNYLVMEAGTWILPDGTLVEAGTLESGLLSSAGFETVAFDAAFDSAPVVLSHVQTFNGRDFVTARQRATDADGFQLTMQEEEALNGGGHAEEKLGWIALEAGRGLARDVSWLAGSAEDVSDANSTIDTDGGLAKVIASLSSFNGADPAWARGAGGTNASFDVSVEEEVSADTETGHTTETVDYFAFDQAGVMAAYDYDFFV
ncbi:hypothetical protein SAMN04488012_107153 [Palleronia salina]|uniref:Uncharacterized protein n=2 Tax=Palleronia salina TaxID=313368 RepID=A0A1M6IEF8_9RHOB|nr:hypothetical protein SAMN04488012_107153 [Palleronia salina]